MIELSNVSKSYQMGEGASIPALVDVFLCVAEGETVSIVGSNGSGKTSLLRCIAGSLIPDSGEVRLLGKAISDMGLTERGRIVGTVYQNPAEGTAPYLTIAENLALGAMRGRYPRLRRLLPAARRPMLKELLASAGGELADRMGQRAGTLSGGQRQSLAMFATVVGGPKILLLDEHTASLDPKARAAVLDLTSSLASTKGLTVLAVTHNVPEALAFGQRLLVMHRGKIVMDLSGDAKASLTPARLIALLGGPGTEGPAADTGMSLDIARNEGGNGDD